MNLILFIYYSHWFTRDLFDLAVHELYFMISPNSESLDVADYWTVGG